MLVGGGLVVVVTRRRWCFGTSVPKLFNGSIQAYGNSKLRCSVIDSGGDG